MGTVPVETSAIIYDRYLICCMFLRLQEHATAEYFSNTKKKYTLFLKSAIACLSSKVDHKNKKGRSVEHLKIVNLGLLFYF